MGWADRTQAPCRTMSLAMMVVPISTPQPGHNRRQRFRLRAPEQQMKMVAHQAVVMEPYREALAVAVQQVEEAGMVVAGLGNDLAVISAVHDVVIGRGRAMLLARETSNGLPPGFRIP